MIPIPMQEQDIPDYITNQQNSSWQIEMLISGGFIFTLLQIPEWIKQFHLNVITSTEWTPVISAIIIGTHLVSRALVIGFAVNLLLRALWLAYLGVNFAYPGGVNYKKLNYSAYFMKQQMKMGNPIERIVRLERIASLSYSITIFMTSSSTAALLITIVLYKLSSFVVPTYVYESLWFGYSLALLIFILVLGSLDRLFFQTFPKASKAYYPLFRFINIITFRFWHYKEWLTLVTNAAKWKVFAVFIAYFFVAMFITTMEVRDYLLHGEIPAIAPFEQRDFLDVPTSHWQRPSLYDDQVKPNEVIDIASLPSEHLSDRFLPVFVIYDNDMDAVLDSFATEANVARSLDGIKVYNDRFKQDSLLSQSIDRLITVYLDRNPIETSQPWFESEHPITHQRGFKTYLDMDTIAMGHHVLHLTYKYKYSVANQRFYLSGVGIPFVKQK